MAIGYSLLVSSLLSQVINSWPNRKLLNYNYFDQLKDIMPGIGLAIIMGFVVYWFKYLPIHNALILIIQVVVGAVIYLAGSIVFKLESYEYIKNILIGYLNRRKNNKSLFI
jgi:hypothetical protein